MYVDDQTFTQNDKVYRRALLRNSYRSNGKIHHDTIANISSCSAEEIDAIKLALKHKSKIKEIVKAGVKIKTKQGLSVGAIWVLNQLAKRIGITKALGKGREAGLVLWMDGFSDSN